MSDFNILLWFLINLINDDGFVSDATANACFMVHLVCLFMKTHPLALLQDSCLDLVRCAFLRKLFGCVRNITASCQKLLSRFCRYQYIGETQTSTRYIGLSLILPKSNYWAVGWANCTGTFRKQGVLRGDGATVTFVWQRPCICIYSMCRYAIINKYTWKRRVVLRYYF